VEPVLLALVVLAGLAHAWMNGMHDAATAVAPSLSTGALTPRAALPMSAVLNVIGALFGVSIAGTFGAVLITVPVSEPGPGLALAAFAAAFGWNLVTWWFGTPSSSTHALVGALAGAGLATGVSVDWRLLGTRVALPMLIAPVLGFAGAWLLMLTLLRLFRDAAHEKAVRGFRMGQSVTAAAMSVGHGMQDGQKTMGVLVLALGVGGAGAGSTVPAAIRWPVALALGLGTLAGGWRIIRTLSRRVVRMNPVTGFAAETVASALLYGSGLLGAPVSTTYTATASIMGAGASGGVRAIRWGTVRGIVAAWVLTPAATFALAAALARLGRLAGF
jgi:PiT family inorganic phosphate transporter